jgi:hypothetical protein
MKDMSKEMRCPVRALKRGSLEYGTYGIINIQFSELSIESVV